MHSTWYGRQQQSSLEIDPPMKFPPMLQVCYNKVCLLSYGQVIINLMKCQHKLVSKFEHKKFCKPYDLNFKNMINNKLANKINILCWALPVIFGMWKVKQVVYVRVMHVDGSPKPSR